MVFTGAPVAGEKDRPDMAKRKTHESHNSRKYGFLSVENGSDRYPSLRAFPTVVLPKLQPSHQHEQPCTCSRTLVSAAAAAVHDRDDGIKPFNNFAAPTTHVIAIINGARC
jgi:hypothetical protein